MGGTHLLCFLWILAARRNLAIANAVGRGRQPYPWPHPSACISIFFLLSEVLGNWYLSDTAGISGLFVGSSTLPSACSGFRKMFLTLLCSLLPLLMQIWNVMFSTVKMSSWDERGNISELLKFLKIWHWIGKNTGAEKKKKKKKPEAWMLMLVSSSRIQRKMQQKGIECSRQVSPLPSH